ncbi:MAG: acyl-CoA synthetase FdrA [Arenicellales bacterium]|nr:acyl-CoA synthetase FdrA [Arenicellales bacterium]
MAVVVNEVRRGLYLDSVALMRYSRTIAAMDGVVDAALMMGTPANKEIMADARLLDKEGEATGGGDLVICIRADNAGTAEAALERAIRLLDKSDLGSHNQATWHPRSLRSALEFAPDSKLALISVPGWFAAAEARKAIRHGLHVMIFSDNVDILEEAELKQQAKNLGRLVMGPDCGTAIINGVPLAFANAVPRGDIGIVGASGTGIQEVSCLLARSGRGISHAIGVGGRDLDERVGGISTLMAVDALDTDAQTKHIIIISKPPPPSVANMMMEKIASSDKEFTVCFLGVGELLLPDNARLATTLKQAAEAALGYDEVSPTFDPLSGVEPVPKNRKRVRGLFSGGTLCAEAQVVFRAAGEDIASNAPIEGTPTITEANDVHCLLDLGDDQYTQGKPHPMIDPSVRDDAIIQALNEKGVGVVLLDLVIGFGVHEDPAGHLATLLARARTGENPGLIVSVTGTDADPQDRAAQIRTLEACGIHVAPSNADAAAMAVSTIRTKC